MRGSCTDIRGSRRRSSEADVLSFNAFGRDGRTEEAEEAVHFSEVLVGLRFSVAPSAVLQKSLKPKLEAVRV